MTYFMRKIFVAIMISSVGYAYADYGNALPWGESENCFSCQADCCCTQGFISADLLYWRAFENGLDVCVPQSETNTVLPGGVVTSTFKGKARDPRFNWNPGFRLGTGFNLGCSKWDVAAYWTHFYSNSHGGGNRPHWKIHFDTVDVIVGYDCDLFCCFTIKPFAGLRGAGIRQRLRIRDLSTSPIAESSHTRNKERFFGIGPLIGLEGDWWLGCGFSLYANASVGWLYGNFHVKLNELDRFVDAIDTSRIKKRLDNTLAVADAALGIRWQKCFCNNMRLVLQCGLEHHRYFDYNRFGSYGDLSFDGVNFSGAVEF